MTVQRSVPFFDYPRVFTDDEEALTRIFKDVGSRGAFIMQKDLRDFEAQLARFTGSENAIGVANATDGLELAWMSVGLQPGDEVIISAHTMLATASSVVIAGGTPVPVDIGDDNLIDPSAIAAAIGPRTVGVMPTQLNGRTCNMTPILDLVQRSGLVLVEDSAQALGSRFDGQHAGTFGRAGAFSFFPAKVLGSLGDGGAVVTDSSETADKVYQLHDHGRDQDGNQVGWGRNSRLDNLQAALLSHRLSSYSDVIARRREVAAAYQERLGDLEQLQLPPAPTDGPHFDVYQNYELQADDRDSLQQYLRTRGIGTLIQWGGKAIHQWEGLGFSCTLPRVERFFQRCIMLPMNTFISNDDVDYICDSVKSFYTTGGSAR